MRSLRVLLAGELDARLHRALEQLPLVGYAPVVSREASAARDAEVVLVAADDGLEQAVALRAADPERAVIALASRPDPALESAAAAAGLADLLGLEGLDAAALGRAIRFALARSARCQDGHGPDLPAAGVARDAAAERALRDSERRFETMASRVPGMVYRATIDRNAVPTFHYAGDGCRELYGVEPAELLADGLIVLRAVHPDDREGFVASITESARTRARWDWRGRLVAADGRVRHIRGISQPHVLSRDTMAWDGIMLDETDVHVARAREAEAQRTFRAAFEQAPIGMALVGLDGRFLQVNDALCAMTGVPPEALTGSSIADITHPDDVAGSLASMVAVVDGDLDVHRTEKRYVHADGHTVWISVSATMIRDAEGKPLHMVSQMLDITEGKRFEQRLQHMADHDPLTGLMNRRRFEAALRDHVVQCQRYGARGSLLVLDIDFFKSVNDTLGHTAGDALITAVARVLRGRLRESDTLARLGGDEFAVLLPRAGATAAAEVAGGLVAAVRERVTIPDDADRHPVTISVGVLAFAPGERLSAEDAVVDADLAMYEAKDAGRDGFSLFRPQEHPQTRATTRQTWVRRVADAIDHDRLVLQARPILDLRTERVTKHELLVRMRDDDGSLIAPGRFLPVAERFGMVPRLDCWVVGQAVTMLERTAGAPEPPALHVNISGRSLGDRHLLDAIRADLRDAPRVEPERLTFEVTETAAVADIRRASEFAGQLRDLGCRFALDDFGAGFGSLYYLKHLPFDVLKIDGEFVANCAHDRTDQLVVESAALLARGLEKETIAGLVQDDASKRMLRRLGVDHIQGQLVGRPVDVEEALGLRVSAGGPAASSAG